MFDGMEEIEGADPYTISDLRTGAPGIGSRAGMAGMGAPLIPEPSSTAYAGVECPPDRIAACKPPNAFDYTQCVCKKAAGPAVAAGKSWYDYIAGGVTAIGGSIGAQAQAAQAAQVQKLQQAAQAGQISQQMYQQQMQMLNQRAALVAHQEAARNAGFFTKYKWYVLGAVVIGGGAAYWFWWRKRR